MEKEKLEGMLIDYIDGTLPATDREWLEREIASNPETAKLFEQTKQLLKAMNQSTTWQPSSSLKTNFEKALKAAEAEQQKGGRVVSFRVSTLYRIAAGVALLLASSFGIYWVNRSIQQERELAAIKAEMEKTKTLMMAMLQNQASAGQRLLGVSVSLKMVKADDEIVDALVHTLESDPNTNVRLASLDALARFHAQPHVRTALVKMLKTQTDPSVQIALIHLLVDIKEKDSLKELQRISTDELALPAVKDEAYSGILKLS